MSRNDVCLLILLIFCYDLHSSEPNLITGGSFKRNINPSVIPRGYFQSIYNKATNRIFIQDRSDVRIYNTDGEILDIIRSGDQLLDEFRDIDVSSDGKYIITSDLKYIYIESKEVLYDFQNEIEQDEHISKFSSDGKYIYVASRDHASYILFDEIDVLSCETGKKVNHIDLQNEIHFFIVRDNHILTINSVNELIDIEPLTGEVNITRDLSHLLVEQVAVSPFVMSEDGRYIYIVTVADGQVVDLEEDKLIASKWAGYTSYPFSKDSKRMILPASGKIYEASLPDLEEIRSVDMVRDADLIQYITDDKILVEDEEGTVVIYDLTGENEPKIILDNGRKESLIYNSTENNYIVNSYYYNRGDQWYDNRISIYNNKSEIVDEFTVRNQNNDYPLYKFNEIKYIPSTNEIYFNYAIDDETNSIGIYDVAKKQQKTTNIAINYKISSFGVYNNNQNLLVASFDGRIIDYDLINNKIIDEYDIIEEEYFLHSIKPINKDEFYFSRGSLEVYGTWKYNKFTGEKTYAEPWAEKTVYSQQQTSWSDNNQYVAIGYEKQVSVWDVSVDLDGDKVYPNTESDDISIMFDKYDFDEVHSLDISDNNKFIVIGTISNVYIYNILTGDLEDSIDLKTINASSSNEELSKISICEFINDNEIVFVDGRGNIFNYKIDFQSSIQTNYDENLIYPQPANDFINIELKDNKNHVESITIYNIDGNISHEINNFVQQQDKLVINIETFTSGVYLLNIKTNSTNILNKIVIRR